MFSITYTYQKHSKIRLNVTIKTTISYCILHILICSLKIEYYYEVVKRMRTFHPVKFVDNTENSVVGKSDTDKYHTDNSYHRDLPSELFSPRPDNSDQW